MNIMYFNVSVSERASDLEDGIIVNINELIAIFASKYKSLFRKEDFVYNVRDFDLLGVDRPMQWERIMKTILFCLSGQIPSRQEVLRGRQIIYQFPKWFRGRYVDKRFVLGFLPYILIGFKSHISDRFVSDSNCLKDICSCIMHFYAHA